MLKIALTISVTTIVLALFVGGLFNQFFGMVRFILAM